MDNAKPGVLELQDSSSSEVRSQDLKKDNLPKEERTILILEALDNISNIPKPGIKAIKQIKLATKWRSLVPEEYRDDFCPIPPKNIIKKYSKEKSTKKGKPVKTKFEKMKVPELKGEVRKLYLLVTGLKKYLISRLTAAIKEKNTYHNINTDIGVPPASTDAPVLL